MGKRVLAGVALGVAAVVLAGVPAGAQTYPPPRNSLTVDDPTPAAGQDVVVTLQTCKRGTVALFGIDRLLLGSAKVGNDGVARATITIPSFEPPGHHQLVGVCIGARGELLVLSTEVRVGPSAAGPVGGSDPQAGGAAVGIGSGSSGGGPGSGSGSGSGMPRLAGLGSGTVPADAPGLFAQAGAASGVPGGGMPDPAGAAGGIGGGAGETAAGRPKAATGGGDGGPGLLASIARVTLGLAALGGVPVALAISRPRAGVRRRRFA